MKVTYDDLLNGYTLQYGDNLVIDDCNYCVSQNYGWYLSGSGCSNDAIFDPAHLNMIDKRHDWANEFGKMIGSASCNFPELDTLPHLTEFVKAIYKKVNELKHPEILKDEHKKSKQIISSLPKRSKTLTHIKL